MQIHALLFILPGLLAGWLVNYLADVLPGQRRLGAPACRGCGARLPCPAYLALRRCPACGARRSCRASIVLLATAVGFVWIGLQPPARLGMWGGWFWFAYLGLIVIIDIEQRLILHVVAAVGAAAAVVSGVGLHGWASTLLGGTVGALTMFAFYLMGIGYARWSARRHGYEIAEGEALGFGDVTFSGVLGLLLGWPGVIGGLLLGVLLAGVVGLLALLPMLFRRQYDPNQALPYGPFLAAAIFYLLFLT